MKKLFLLFLPIILAFFFTLPFFIKSPSYADVCKYNINVGTSCSTVGNGTYKCTWDSGSGFVGTFYACATGKSCYSAGGGGGGGGDTGASCLYSCGSTDYVPNSKCTTTGTNSCGTGNVLDYPVTRSDANCNGQICCQNPNGGSCDVNSCGYYCDSSCNEYSPSCSTGSCGSGGSLYASNTSACDQVWPGISCPGGGGGTPPTGNFDGADCSVFNGWTCDADNYSQALTVAFYDGPGWDHWIANGSAGNNRQDLVDAGVCGGTGNHGFWYTTPNSLKDGNTHQIYAYPINIGPDAGYNPELGSPISITCNPPPPPVAGGWSGWSGCSAFCGPGIRTRTCTNPTPSNGGADCSQLDGGNSFQSCNTQACVCNSGISCGACNVACGSGSESCTYTTYSGGGACTQTPAPNQPCAPLCSTGYSCTSNVCVCNAPAIPAVRPSGTIPPGSQNININWDNTGATYDLWIDDQTLNGWNGLCNGSQNPGDVCTDGYASTSYTFHFIAGHTYSIWVHAVAACGVLSSPGSTAITIPANASGQVYIDAGKNGRLDPGVDSAYTGGTTITICQGNHTGGCSSPYETISSKSDGTFTTANTKSLTAGQYTAILTLPSGYQAISPKPPVAVFTVGENCAATAPAGCDAYDNVLNLNFGITNSFPWMQSVGGDITGSFISKSSGGGFTDNIPQTADLTCSSGSYALAAGAGGTHGLINTGSSSTKFGLGQEAAAQNWIVGGLGSGNYPYVYNMPISNQAQTSFTNLSYLVKQSNIHTDSLDSYCSGGVSNCTLPTTTASFPSGVYTVNGNLTLNGASGTYTFPSGGKYIILVNGILAINTKVFVPNGSFVLFSAANDINVNQTVGDTSHVTTSNLEGYYSTDKSFNVQSKDASGQGANCGTNNEDLRLNVAGAIVVNADTSNNGGFYYQRDMCANDLKCPVFTITERPDFILNSPTFLMFPRRVWQEVAP